ncbi:MAG: YihY/virulence factor BrkB family protein [Aerococcus sp.]|nr:YihY/virulence factor BrkB family protein [Aerococcus sp.]
MNQRKREAVLPIVMKTVQKADIGGSAAELAYYSLLALLPVLLLIANIIPLLPFDRGSILNIVEQFVPDQVESLIVPTLSDYLQTVNAGAISVSLILAIWTASVAFSSLQKILNRVYDRPLKGNVIITRLFSFLITFLLVIVAGALGMVYVFGETLLTYFQTRLGLELQLIQTLFSFQQPILFVALLLLFTFIYMIVPNVRQTFKYSFPGAVVASFLSLLLSALFGYYVTYFGGSSVGNGTLGVFIILMLYLFLNAIVIIIGAMVNIIYYHVEHVHDFMHDEKDLVTYAEDDQFDTTRQDRQVLRGEVTMEDEFTRPIVENEEAN